MKNILIASAFGLIAVAAGPASADRLGLTAKPFVRGIPVHPQRFDSFTIKKPVRIIGIVVRPHYPIRGLVIDRPMGGINGPLVRGVPVQRF